MIREYKTIREISGPLMVVDHVQGVTYDELAEIVLSDGSTRRCKVLEVNGDRAVAVDLEHLAAARAAVGEDDLCQLVIRDALHMVHDHQRAGNFADRLIFTDHSSFSPFSAIAAICSSISTSRFA